MLKHANIDAEKAMYRFLLGLLAGFFMGNHFLPILVKKSSCYVRFPAALTERYDPTQPEKQIFSRPASSGLVYIGMMSMDDKLSSRVEAALRTWIKNPNPLVKVEVFANNNGSLDPVKRFRQSQLRNEIRVLQLPGVSDHVYPPQKKSFSMIKFMHDEYLHQFDWFVRLDDDAYADTEKLVTLLSSLNSSKPIYLGHAGFGKDNNDYLDASKEENYCMGGTGMVFSKSLLRIFAPHLKKCLENLLTEHEDIELGRCVSKMSGVKCTTSWETRKLFYQNFKNGTYAHNILDPVEENIENGVLFHANKDPRYQQNFHVKILSIKIKKLIARITKLENEIRRDYNLNRERYDWTSNSYSHLRWNSIVKTTAFTSQSDMKKEMHVNLLKKFLGNTNVFLKKYKKSNPNSFKDLKYAALAFSYHVVNPLLSTDVISQINLVYKKDLKFHSRKNQPIFIHQRQYFSNFLPFFREPNKIIVERLNEIARQKLNRKFSSNQRLPQSTSRTVPVNFLTALNGRLENTVRFLKNFEKTFLKTYADANLIVVYFPLNQFNEKSEGPNQNILAENQINITTAKDKEYIQAYMNSLQKLYTQQLIKLVVMPEDTEFSRGIGLQEASKHVEDSNEILFFCDVDLVFAPDLIERIRQNTIQGKRVYYPVFFSQYDPDVVYVEREKPKNPFHFDELNGFWRIFSYGMFSIYKSDFTKTNGFNVAIRGWGLEDVEMLDSLLKTNLDVFQCGDPGIVHIFHEKFCHSNTTKLQYKGCVQSKFSHYGPKTLLYYLYNAHEVEKDVVKSDKTS